MVVSSAVVVITSRSCVMKRELFGGWSWRKWVVELKIIYMAIESTFLWVVSHPNKSF